MNHGSSFWAYYRELKREVQALQRANYFGDGKHYEEVVVLRFSYKLQDFGHLVEHSKTGRKPKGYEK